MDDEEIQRLIEEQLKGTELPRRSEDKDLNLYRLLFMELKKEPLEMKDMKLTENVIGKILVEQDRRERIYYGLVIAVVIILVSGLTYFVMERTDSVTLNTITDFLIANKVICFFILSTFCLIQVLDKYLVKRNIPLNRN
jgi:hypothetical protein